MILSIFRDKLPLYLILEIKYYLLSNELFKDIENFVFNYNLLMDKNKQKICLKSLYSLFEPSIMDTNPFYYTDYTIKHINKILKNIIMTNFNNNTDKDKDKFNFINFLKKFYKHNNKNDNELLIIYNKIYKKRKYINNIFFLRLFFANFTIQQREDVIKLIYSTIDEAWTTSKINYLKNN